MKYRLLKDLPDASAGAIFDTEDQQRYLSPNWKTEASGLRHGNGESSFDMLKEWFEPIPEQERFIVKRILDPDSDFGQTIETHFNATSEEAEEIRDAIEILMAYIHCPEGSDQIVGLNTDLQKSATAARKKLQGMKS